MSDPTENNSEAFALFLGVAAPSLALVEPVSATIAGVATGVLAIVDRRRSQRRQQKFEQFMAGHRMASRADVNPLEEDDDRIDPLFSLIDALLDDDEIEKNRYYSALLDTLMQRSLAIPLLKSLVRAVRELTCAELDLVMTPIGKVDSQAIEDLGEKSELGERAIGHRLFVNGLLRDANIFREGTPLSTTGETLRQLMLLRQRLG